MSEWNVNHECETEDGDPLIIGVRYRKLSVLAVVKLKAMLTDTTKDNIDSLIEQAGVLLRNPQSEWEAWPMDAFAEIVTGHPFLRVTSKG